MTLSILKPRTLQAHFLDVHKMGEPQDQIRIRARIPSQGQVMIICHTVPVGKISFDITRRQAPVIGHPQVTRCMSKYYSSLENPKQATWSGPQSKILWQLQMQKRFLMVSLYMIIHDLYLYSTISTRFSWTNSKSVVPSGPDEGLGSSIGKFVTRQQMADLELDCLWRTVISKHPAVSSNMAGKSPTRCTFSIIFQQAMLDSRRAAVGYVMVCQKDWHRLMPIVRFVRYASLFYIAFYPDSFKMSESWTDFPDFFCRRRWVTG